MLGEDNCHNYDCCIAFLLKGDLLMKKLISMYLAINLIWSVFTLNIFALYKESDISIHTQSFIDDEGNLTTSKITTTNNTILTETYIDDTLNQLLQ